MDSRETFAQALCDILVKHQVISSTESRAMHRVFKESEKEQFDDFLLEEGLVEEAPLLRALAEHFQVPPVDVVGYFFDHTLLKNFPKDFLLQRRIIPLELDSSIVVMVASRPDNAELLPDIGKYVSADVQFRVGLGRDIEDAIKEYYDPSLTEPQNDDYDPEIEHDEKEALKEVLAQDDIVPFEEEE